MNDSLFATRDPGGYREVRAALLDPGRYHLSLEATEAILRLYRASPKGLVSILHRGGHLTVSWHPMAGVHDLFAVELDLKGGDR